MEGKALPTKKRKRETEKVGEEHLQWQNLREVHMLIKLLRLQFHHYSLGS